MDQSKDELFIRGKANESDQNIDVYIELQPVRNIINSLNIKILTFHLDNEVD